MKLIKITPDDNVIEGPEERADIDKEDRIYDGVALMVPQMWKHKNNSILTLSLPDLYEKTHNFNKLATLISQKLHTPDCHDHENITCGDCYVANENDEEILDFTLDDFRCVLKQGLKLDL